MRRSPGDRAAEEAAVLEALNAYDVAVRSKDVEGQVAFFAEDWRASSGMSKAELRSHLEDQRERDALEEKRLVWERAEITVDGDRATIDPVAHRSPTGGGFFAFEMLRESDGVWRCLAVVGTNELDESAESARSLRERILSDPHRPGYHFVIPEGVAMPFDPNGAIFWKGRYHLFYIFQDTRIGKRSDHWGHMSSADLFHWREHPTGLLEGMYSGNAFLNREGVPTICYHQAGQGNAMAVALDDDLNEWRKLGVITPETREGDEMHGRYRSWDPYGWVEGNHYYAIFGGQSPGVAKSESLEGPWRYVGDLFAHGLEGVSLDEDVSCPDLFRLGDRDVLMCISHRLGCRYYVGEWKNEQFHPESHAQMSWVDNCFFAPESLVDDRGRRIVWSWILDEPLFGARSEFGWSGTLSLPRVLTMGEDGLLRFDLPEEIEALRGESVEHGPLTIAADSQIALDDVSGNSLELLVEFAPMGVSRTRELGVQVCVSPNAEEATTISYDADAKELRVDTRRSGPEDTPRVVESAPFELAAGESLSLRIFVDRSVVEVFANSRQAIARRVYPSRADSVGVRLFTSGGSAEVRSISSWRLAPSNPF